MEFDSNELPSADGYESKELQEYKKRIHETNHEFSSKLRRLDSNERPLGYEPNELPLLHSAIFCGAKVLLLFVLANL